MQPVYCLYRPSGRIPTVLRRYPYGHCTKRNPHRRTFRQNTEEYGQTLPAVLEPNGMNFWTPQTQDTEAKCKAPYYYKDTKIQGFRNSHWIVGGCTQDYGSMTLMPVSGTLKYLPQDRGSLFSHQEETATPAYYSVLLKDYSIFAEMTGRSRSAIFRFTYNQPEDAYLIVNPNSDEGKGYIEIDTIKTDTRIQSRPPHLSRLGRTRRIQRVLYH